MNNIEYELFVSQLKEQAAEYFADEDNIALFEQWKREEQENG